MVVLFLLHNFFFSLLIQPKFYMKGCVLEAILSASYSYIDVCIIHRKSEAMLLSMIPAFMDVMRNSCVL